MKNKKKNAFTLIELLAIIVILAIIAVITVPIILNIIENSKKGAAQDSAYGYKESVEKYYVSRLIENNNEQDTILNGIYTISDGKLNNNIDIPFEGTKPTSGFLMYEKNILKSSCIIINDYVTEYNGKTFSVTNKLKCPTVLLINDADNNNEISFGDEYAIGSETFYVINSDTNNVTLLAKYNLNVGNNKKTTVPEGLQNSTLGKDYGYILFSPAGAFTLTTPGTIEDIYNKLDNTSNDNISYYVEQYVNRLKQFDQSLNITGRLLTYSETQDVFGCDMSQSTCPTNTFLTTSSFWLGSSPQNDIVFYVDKNEWGAGVYGTPCNITAVNLGVRPVIVIPRSSI